jgi:uncharacterized protein YPO0396
MSRAIRLTRLHAINWYGYNDTLPVEGNLLLAGVTGSGKSVLMDLVMTVLVGTDVAHQHFNRSATGGKSDRTLKSYCLLDTKREENGLPQYQRDKGAITYIVLEFAWPAKTGEETRVETWGLRIEFRNAAENQGHIRAFYCDGALSRDDFLTVRTEDGRKVAKELPEFRRLIEKERDGRLFETQEQYLRDMANEQHLNFNRGVLAALLPQAMSFTNRKSFDGFIRDFVLPGDQLNVDDVVASYRSFLAFERDLKELRDQETRLKAIRELFAMHAAARRDQVVARWLAAELSHAHAAAEVKEREEKLTAEKAAFAKEEARLTELSQLIERRKSDIEQLKNLIRTTPGGETYLFIKERNRTLTREIAELESVGTRVEEALRNRVRKARHWLATVKAAPLDKPVDVSAIDSAITGLESCPAEQHETALQSLATEAEAVKAALNRAINPLRQALAELRSKLGKLREEISALEVGQLPFPTTLLQALIGALPWEGRQPPAQPLCKLCEVRREDEKWRAAIEVAFTRKFAIVVSEANYEKAQKIYQWLKADSPQESLVNPVKARRLNREPKPGSLATKLETPHPVAQAIVNQLFGDLICVERAEELAKHDYAILPDGFMTRGAFVERRRHYDNLPFVGQRGLEQQLALKKSQWKDLEAQNRRDGPKVDAVDAVIQSTSQFIPEHASLTRDLVEAKRLPKLKEDLDGNIAKLNAIDRASFEEKEAQLNKLESALGELTTERDGLLGSQKKGLIQQLEKELKAAQERTTRELASFERVKSEVGDISIHAARLNEWRTEVTTRLPALDAAAREFEHLESDAKTNAGTAWANLKSEREKLALVYRKFDELLPDNPSNEPWEKLFKQVEEANIPDYEQKAKAERARWENLFRTQVLQKLDVALRRLRDIVVVLNGLLKQPIGNDRYEIQAKPNPEFKQHRELVSLNAQSVDDGLFYQQVQGELRTTLDNFLKVLVEQPDSLEAARLLDYRHYYDYDLLVWNANDPQAPPQSVDKQSGKMSGGENQSPYFVAILASYLRAYNRHESRWRTPSLALVPIDEAFSKMDTERIRHCIDAIQQLDLQGVFSMSTGNVPAAFDLCDQLIVVARHEERRGTRIHIRNVPVSILRDSEDGREWIEENE